MWIPAALTSEPVGVQLCEIKLISSVLNFLLRQPGAIFNAPLLSVGIIQMHSNDDCVFQNFFRRTNWSASASGWRPSHR